MEKHRPSKCKWCGAKAKVWNRQVNTVSFGCESWYGIEWQQSASCKLNVANDRIQRALETLDDAGVIRMRYSDGDEYDWVVDASVIEAVRNILEGESDAAE